MQFDPAPFYTLIALVAIVGPESTEPPACPLYSLQSAAVSLELMDPREGRWYFVCSEQLSGDLRTMRDRYSDLWDAPPLCDRVRFPCEEMCRTCLDWNYQYTSWLKARKRLLPSEEWIDEALEESEYLWRLWDYARDAQKDYYVYWRRYCLRRMREIVGPQMYCAGCLPAPVPVWRFWRID